MELITSLIRRLGSVLGLRETRISTQEPTAPAQPPRNYTQERETTRTDALSAEEQAWEMDRRQRDQDTQARDPSRA